MDKFQVIPPSVLLAPYVRQYWFLSMENVEQGTQRLIPFGCVSLIFHRVQESDSLINGMLPESCLFGQSTAYLNLVYSGTIHFISVVFQPAGASAFFKTPLKELYNQHISIRALEDPPLAELEKRLMDISDNERCVRLIEEFLLKRMGQLEENKYKRWGAVMESIHRRPSDIPTLAQTACLSYKQFKRVFKDYIGINPKDFLRISRFQKASHQLQIQAQTTLTQIADECGYYDISHLIKEFKEFSGYTPGEFLSVCGPYSGYHALFRSAFMDTKC